VRTTAYTESESDHIKYANHNALGTSLQSGTIHSAAADWSRWPAGTIFRIRDTGEVYQVDDYGWALAGTNTIDLYKPSREEMRAWGVRPVIIENIQWGDPDASLAVLRERSHYRHVRRMIKELEARREELKRPVPEMGPPPTPVMVASVPAPVPSASSTPAMPAQGSTPSRTLPTSGSGTYPVARDPFYAGSNR
jgi:3D (Asp-Asp-Asp) domain-containing protein